MEATDKEEKKHFVLVHGACHGAWCWHKVTPRLESCGHRVTLIDLAASGNNKKEIHEVHSLYEYSEPLLEVMGSLGHSEKVILVGHSLGGFSLALAMEMFPEKVHVAVFVTAFMPDVTHHISYVLDKYFEMVTTSKEFWLDTQLSSYGTSSDPRSSIHFGPKFLASKLYQLSPLEDLELAIKLSRPALLYRELFSQPNKLTEEVYGSVCRIYLVCENDQCIPENFQRWMITNAGGVKEVMEIKGADHMPMFSQVEQLCDRVLDIARVDILDVTL